MTLAGGADGQDGSQFLGQGWGVVPVGGAHDVNALGGECSVALAVFALELVASLSSGQAVEDALDLGEVEDPLQFGFVDGVGQLLLGEDVGQVDQRAGEAGDWDVVD